MAVMDEFREERRNKLKNASLGYKLDYFWCYYKWHVIGISAVIALGIMILHTVITYKDNAFYVAMVNSMVADEDAAAEFTEAFAELTEIDIDKHNLVIDNGIMFSDKDTKGFNNTSSQKLMSLTASRELDVMLAGSDIFPNQANQDMFHDLRDILSEEQLAKYEPYFYYVDKAVIDFCMNEENMYLEESQFPQMPAPTKPEEMDEPVPVGIFVTDCEKLTDIYQFTGDYIAVGVMVNSERVELALDFIDYLFSL